MKTKKPPQLEKSTKAKTSTDSDVFGSPADSTSNSVEATPDFGSKEAQKYEKTWLKMSDKHQFKYYLNSDDREEIKAQRILQNKSAE